MKLIETSDMPNSILWDFYHQSWSIRVIIRLIIQSINHQINQLLSQSINQSITEIELNYKMKSPSKMANHSFIQLPQRKTLTPFSLNTISESSLCLNCLQIFLTLSLSNMILRFVSDKKLAFSGKSKEKFESLIMWYFVIKRRQEQNRVMNFDLYY